MRVRQDLHGRCFDGAFPRSPIRASALLEPITSWSEMFREAQAVGVEFDEFWHQAVEDGVASFCRWLGEQRATVLVVHDESGITYVECRKVGDVQLSRIEAASIIAAVVRAYRTPRIEFVLH